MTPAVARAAAPEGAACRDDGMIRAPMSCRKDVAQGSGLGSRAAMPRGIDARAFGRWLAPRVAVWMREQYGTPERIAEAFGVRHSTACNWLRGDHMASGGAVALMFMFQPDALAWFLAEWRRRE